MSEIQYYGGASDSDNTPFFGALVKAWSQINSARSAMNQIGINIPYIYIMSLDEALDVNSKSFTFPLRVWVSNGDNIYSPPHFAKHAMDFRNIIEQLNKESTVIVSRAPIHFDNSVIYLAKDGAVVKIEAVNGYYPISADMNPLWKSLGLDENIAIRLRYPSSGCWTVDALIDRDNDYLNEMFGASATQVSAKAFESFRRGFFLGFNTPLTDGISHLHNHMPSLTSDGYRISNALKVARIQGFCVGQDLKSKVGNHFASLSAAATEAQKVKAFAKISPGVFQQLKVLSRLHNAVVEGDDRVEVENELRAYFSHEVPHNFLQIQGFNNRMSDYFSNMAAHSLDINRNDYDNYSEKLSFDENLNFEIVEDVSFDNAQFRILAQDLPHLSIRFQSKTAKGVRRAITDSGKEYVVSSWEKEVEITFKVDNFSAEKAEKLSELTYSQPSNAGTPAKYAPCKVVGDKLVSVEGDIEIASFKILKEQLQPYFA